MADSSEYRDQSAMAGCGHIAAFDNMDCGEQGNPGASNATTIGSGPGWAVLTSEDHGSTWGYFIKFFNDFSRPTQTYTLTEVGSDHPHIEVLPGLPMAPNCADGRPCWVLYVREGCGVKGGSKRLYLCLGGGWEELEEVQFQSVFAEAEEVPEGVDPDGTFWAIPGGRVERTAEGFPFIGTRLAMGAE